MARYIRLSDLAVSMEALPGEIEAATVEGIREGARASLPVMRRRTERAVPAWHTGQPGAVATERYLHNWRVDALISDGASVYNDQPYASTIELGQPPGELPPLTNIVRWLAARFGYDSGSLLTWRIAMYVARSIHRRGLLAREVMIGAVDEVADIAFTHVVDEITDRLTRI